MDDAKALAWNLLRRGPSRVHPHAIAEDTSKETQTRVARRHQETADHYPSVVALLSERWRVILCKDGIQWILQHRKKGGADRPWRGEAYCTTRAALIRLCASLEPPVEAKAQAVLEALPQRIGGRAHA